MTYLKLFLSFFKVGLFSFGGGYAMIPLIQKEMEINGWLSHSEFVNIISISQMTPGPIAVNSATFVGYRVAGFFGSTVATVGVALPSLILIMVISGFFYKFRTKPINLAIFYGIKLAITGLIAAAGIFVAEEALLKEDISVAALKGMVSKPMNFFDIGGIVIFVLSLLAIIKFKIHPILVIIAGGAAGILIYSFIPAP